MTKFSITRIPYPIIMSVFKLTSLSSFCYSFEFFKSMSDFEIFLTIKLWDAVKKIEKFGGFVLKGGGHFRNPISLYL